MRPIRIAAQLHPQHGTYREIRRGVLEAEDLGFDIAYTWDHFHPLYGPVDGPHLECWSLLAAWAEATERIGLGPLVSCVSYRNPNLLADMARTLDQVSGGRAILGLGAGWFRRDYDDYGYPFGTVAERIDALERDLAVIARRRAILDPPPIGPLPVLIGGAGPRRTMRLVARHADGWHAGFPERPAELEPAIAALRRWCAEIDRDPATIEWGVGVEPDDLERFLAEDAATYIGLGFSQFTLGFNGPDWRVLAGRPWLDWRDELNRAREDGPKPDADRTPRPGSRRVRSAAHPGHMIGNVSATSIDAPPWRTAIDP